MANLVGSRTRTSRLDLLQTLRRNRHACSHCGCEARAYQVGTRYVQGVPTGKLLTYFEIYRFAESPYDAMLQFRSWMAKANATEVPELVAMAGMIRRHQKGMLGFWKLNRKSSASMEGFNGKVRWLMKQAYGFRDFKFLRLKIFDLPSMDTKRHL